jgi:hypothetical protein
MDRKSKSLPGAKPKGIEWVCADRANNQYALDQYTHLWRFIQYRDNPEQYCRRMIPCLMADAFVMLRPMLLPFPAHMRDNCYLDTHGCLRCLTNRRAE